MSKFPSISRVQLYGSNAHECGYCKNNTTEQKDTSVSYGVVSETMAIEDYQNLMMCGWRRSGTYYYKPTMHKTCCPQYTIRLRVNDFKMSKSQKKVLKNVDKFLNTIRDDTSFSTEENLKISSVFTMKPNIKPEEFSPNSKSRLTIELDYPTSTSEKFELYKQYQVEVHKDNPEKVTESGFKRFLVDSSLVDTNNSPKPDTLHMLNTNSTTGSNNSNSTDNNSNTSNTTTSTSNNNTFQYGTYHQLYRLDNKLIAVGIVDILPTGLSSVYLFYDNSYKQLALGKYTALKEIEFCKTHHFEYYYMGFYIHSCEKMRYKGEYKPSELLCPTTLQWYSLDNICENILNRYRFSPFESIQANYRNSNEFAYIDVGRDSSGSNSNSNSSSNDKEKHITDNNSNNNESSEHTTSSSGSKAIVENTTQSYEDQLKLLEIFAPQFFNNDNITTTSSSTGSIITASSKLKNKSVSSKLKETINKVPLDIGMGMPVYLNQLQAKNIEQLGPVVQEWVENVGPDIARTIAISFT